MHTALLHTHSLLRYALLILPVAIIISLLINRGKAFKKRDTKMLLWLTICAHTQLLVGILLFLKSPYVKFSGSTMKNAELRYWSVEHPLMMLAVVVLITMAKVYSRKPVNDALKSKRVLILVGISLLIMLATISMSGRGLLIPTGSS